MAVSLKVFAKMTGTTREIAQMVGRPHNPVRVGEKQLVTPPPTSQLAALGEQTHYGTDVVKMLGIDTTRGLL